MSIICKAFLINGVSNSEYLVNVKNLPAFLFQHREAKEVVVTGPFHKLLVLSMKRGVITYCSDEKIRAQLQRELNSYSRKEPQMYLYEVTVIARHFESILVYAESRWQALKIFSQWSLVKPFMIKLV